MFRRPPRTLEEFAAQAKVAGAAEVTAYVQHRDTARRRSSPAPYVGPQQYGCRFVARAPGRPPLVFEEWFPAALVGWADVGGRARVRTRAYLTAVVRTGELRALLPGVTCEVQNGVTGLPVDGEALRTSAVRAGVAPFAPAPPARPAPPGRRRQR